MWSRALLTSIPTSLELLHEANVDSAVDEIKILIEGGFAEWFSYGRDDKCIGECKVEPYGSYATGPHCVPSDLFQEAVVHWRNRGGSGTSGKDDSNLGDDVFDVDLVVCLDDLAYGGVFSGKESYTTVASSLVERLADFLRRY